ncbi:MAG: serine/threonine protein kinase [Thermoleophilia bacterium]|nr:serine/threonine protein kinase [Thermoleophilia bacterium]
MARRRREREQAVTAQFVTGYHDLQPIAQGGFSVVYRAFQESFNRTVALKVLEVDLSDPSAQAAFWAECAATGRLTGHPNIVTVLDSGLTAGGKPYLAVDYYERGSLGDRLRSEGPLPVDEVLRIGIKIAGALETAHSAGILHRDVKPQNILMSQFGEPALADFGIAAFDAESAVRVAGTLTPVHAAPEVLIGQPASRTSDVYSLGSTLYLLLAGRAPHESRPGESLDELQRRVVTEPVAGISRTDVPSMITDVLCRMIAAEPTNRYPSALDAGMALRDLQRRLGHARTDLLVPAAAQGPRPGQDEVISLRQEGAKRSLPDIVPVMPGAPDIPGIPDGKRSLPPLPPAAARLEINLGPGPPPPAPGASISSTVARTTPPIDEQLLDPPANSRTIPWLAVAAIAVAIVAIAALIFVIFLDGDSGSPSGPRSAVDALPAEKGAEPTEVKAEWIEEEIAVSWDYEKKFKQLTYIEIVDKQGKPLSSLDPQSTENGETSYRFLKETQGLAELAGNTTVCARVLSTYKKDGRLYNSEPVTDCSDTP